MIGELVADYYKDQVLNPSDLDRDSAAYGALVERGTAIARMVAAMSAALIGRNPDDAAFSAGAAVTYNALSHLEKTIQNEFEDRLTAVLENADPGVDIEGLQTLIARQLIEKYKLKNISAEKFQEIFPPIPNTWNTPSHGNAINPGPRTGMPNWIRKSRICRTTAKNTKTGTRKCTPTA